MALLDLFDVIIIGSTDSIINVPLFFSSETAGQMELCRGSKTMNERGKKDCRDCRKKQRKREKR